MTNLLIEKQNETYLIVRIDDESVRADLNSYFQYEQINYKFTKRYKQSKGKWNGKVSLYNVATGKLMVGLYWHLMRFADKNGLNVISTYTPTIADIQVEDTLKFIDKLNIHSGGVPIDVYDYQIEAIHYALKYNRALLLSPTSSGKSVIIYAIVRAFLKQKKRVLIAVPSKMLVNQLLGDFKDYASQVSWDSEKACTAVFYGSEKDYGKAVVVGTWQSLVKLSPEYLSTFDCVIGDEAHLMTSTITSGLIQACTNATGRIGTTGTLDGKVLSAIYLQGMFGATYRTISIRDLIDSGRVADPKIHCGVLKYPKDSYKDLDITDYHQELDWIVTNNARMKFMTNLANKCQGNTMVLFNFVEKHGKPLYEMMKEKLKNKLVLYVSGEVNLDDREDIKLLFKTHNNIVLIISYGTGSTGISIKEIDNLILGSPTKSRIRLWQSIGRTLRLYKGKIYANIFDISDDLRKEKIVNHTFKHAKERALEYEKEKIDYEIFEVDLKKYY